MRPIETLRGIGFGGLSMLCALGCGASKDVGANDGLGNGDDGGVSFDIGGSDGLDPESGIAFQDIELTPANATVYIDTASSPATPASVTYKAVLHNSDGTSKDVTSTVALQLDDSTLGKFSGATFTSVDKLPGGSLGVTTVVHGTAEGKSGSANLTIVELRKTGDHRDFYFIVPYLGAPSPERDVLRFGTNIKQVDVAFSVDTTGSMGSSIANLKANLSTTIIPALAKAIPSVGIAVAYHDDYPFGSHGSNPCAFGSGALPGDVPEGTITVVTTDVPTAQAAANKLETHCGDDEPESQVPSMYQIVTGKGLTWPGGSVAPHTPAVGTTGGVDFRAGSLPVVVEITDAHWHDATFDPYTDIPTAPELVKDLEPAFKAINAKFVGVFDTHFQTYEDQEILLSDATGSSVPPVSFGACTGGSGPCCTLNGGAGRPADGPGGNCRLNFQIMNGTGLSSSIVKAIQAISVGSQFDVTAVPSNDPSNADGVNATLFIKALRAMDEGDASNKCAPHAAKDTNGDGIKDTFIAVVVGTPVCFEVLPQENTTVRPKPSAQFFNAFIDVLGMPGAVKLDRRNVLFLVPPKEIGAK